MNKLSLASSCLVACVVLGLAGCGGGGGGAGGAAETPVPVAGRIAGVAASGVAVCLDANRNLACDATEPSARTGSDGAFTLTAPSAASLDTAFVVAELRAADVPATASTRVPTGNAAFALAAPAARSVTLDAVSTLVAAAMRADTTQSRAQAEAALKQSLAVADLQTIEGAAWGALHDGSRARIAQGNVGAAQATLDAAPVVSKIIARYIDKSRGTWLPHVSTKTLNGEAVGAFTPPACAVQAPPLLRIATAASAPIVSREDYVDARLTMAATTAYPEAIDAATRIRGRGNSTWGFDKKPYKLKLDRKASLLGMPTDTEWALLAHHADKTLLRNALAMCLGRTLAMNWTPSARFVELELNGRYDGVYELYEQVKAADARVAIGTPATSDGDADAGFLLEIDARLDADFWFRSGQNVPYAIKSDATAGQVPTIAGTVNRMEQALFSTGYTDVRSGYAAHLDVEALVDFYLINELLRNTDTFGTSTFVHRTRGGQLTFGPLWDFDIAAGNINYGGNDLPEGWRVREMSPYLKRLLTDPAFAAQLAARWQYLSSRLPAVQQFIDQGAVALNAAQQRNFQRWDILDVKLSPNPVALGSHAAEVAHLKDWLTKRAAWMDAQLSATR